MKKNYIKLFVAASLFITLSACAQKDKEENEEPVETTSGSKEEGNTSVTIEAGKNGKVEVETDEGTDVKIDVDKKGGSIEVKDGENKVDIEVKDDDKK